MADGYARATGKPAVVLVTSGPGAGNTITGIMTAHMDSVPMIIITGQQVTWMLGKDAFQEADIFGITMPVVKHNFLVRKNADLPRVAREAYHIATTGRPGPVLVDVPKNVSQDEFVGDLHAEIDLPGYNAEVAFDIDENQVQAAADLINLAERPVILAGHGAMIAGAEAEADGAGHEGGNSGDVHPAGKGRFPGIARFVAWHAGDARHGLRKQGDGRKRPDFEHRLAL